MFGWFSEPARRDSRTNRRAVDGIGDRQRGQLLERHQAVEVGLAREIDGRHAAAAELAHELVPADRATFGHDPARYAALPQPDGDGALT